MPKKQSEIVSDEAVLEGEPVVRGTKTPVRAIVELWRMGVSPEEIPGHLPHIGLDHVFEALAYYLRNQDEIAHYIELNHVPDHLVLPLIRQKPAGCVGTDRDTAARSRICRAHGARSWHAGRR